MAAKNGKPAIPYLAPSQKDALINAMAVLNEISMANDPSNAEYNNPDHNVYNEEMASDGEPIALLLEQYIARHGYHG